MSSDHKVSMRRLASIVGLALVLAGLLDAVARAQVGSSIPTSLRVGDSGFNNKKKHSAYPPQ